MASTSSNYRMDIAPIGVGTDTIWRICSGFHRLNCSLQRAEQLFEEKPCDLTLLLYSDLQLGFRIV